MSARLNEFLNQERSRPVIASRGQVINRALADLNDLEAILLGTDAENDEELTLVKDENGMEDLGSSAQKNLRGWFSNLRGKRNYNLDHLARMNFRRSDPSWSSKRFHPSKFNDRHILGGLRKK